MTTDSELLRSYAERRSEDAFAELVQRHLNLVYSAALRQVNGNAALAQDVAQMVFTDLARKSASLWRRAALTGWLYTSAHFAAAKALRAESRRQAREQEAHTMRELLHEPATDLDWEKLRPVLDNVMHKLKEADREAILLRYFENRPLAEIGARLDLSENAARMRVERALEKLRGLLASRGVATIAAISTVISANAVQVAPASLAATLTGASLAGAAGTGTTITLLKFMTMTKLKAGMIGALIVASVAAPLVIQQHQAGARLREQFQAMQQQLEELRAENARLADLSARGRASQSLSDEQLNELARLRGEVSALRKQNQELSGAQAESRPAGSSGPPGGTNVSQVLNAPTVPLMPAASWANLGTASPDATLQTLYWAMSKHDTNAFSAAIAWGPEIRAQAEALFAGAPEAVRQKFGSIDGVLYAMLSALPPIAGLAVVSQNIQGDDGILVEQHQYEDGRVRQNQVTLHHFDDGWRIVFGDDKALRGFDATLKFAGQTR